MPALRIPMSERMRDAAETLFKDFAEDRSIKLQFYRGRPRSIFPPTAFCDRISERIDYLGPILMQRHPVLEVVVLHGLFDSLDAVTQRDTFVDGFLDWQADRFHAAGSNTTLGVVTVEDDPEYLSSWQPPEQQRTYYASRFSMEGLALD